MSGARPTVACRACGKAVVRRGRVNMGDALATLTVLLRRKADEGVDLSEELALVARMVTEMQTRGREARARRVGQ